MAETRRAVIICMQIMSFGSERCVSWNFSANGGEGNWTADGCETIGLVDGVVTCQCDHLTNFAILVVSTYCFYHLKVSVVPCRTFARGSMVVTALHHQH